MILSRDIQVTYLDIAISVVPNFHEPIAACRESLIDTSHDIDVMSHISRSATEVLSRVEHWCLEKHIVNLSVQHCSAPSHKQASSSPSDPCILKEIGCQRPISCKWQEEHHLLAAVNDIDHSCGGRSCDVVSCCWSKLGNLPGDLWVGNLCRIMVQSFGGESSAAVSIQ